MYYCNECGEYFDKPEIEWFDYPIPFNGAWERKEYEICPFCGSQDFEET